MQIPEQMVTIPYLAPLPQPAVAAGKARPLTVNLEVVAEALVQIRQVRAQAALGIPRLLLLHKEIMAVMSLVHLRVKH